MNRSEFEKNAKGLLEQQLELFAAKSQNGHFLTEEEVSTVKAIVETWVRLQDNSRKSSDGRDLTKRVSKYVSDEALIEYAKDRKK